MITEQAVWKQLHEIKDPAFGSPLSVVDVGMIHEVKVSQGDVYVAMMMFNRSRVSIANAASPIRQMLLGMEGVGEVRVECVWEPEWTPDRLSPAAREALGFEAGDPVEGRLHVRSEHKADPETAEPVDERILEGDRLCIPGASWTCVEDLPRDRFEKWWGGWRYCKRVAVEETIGMARNEEPVHVDLAFPADQVRDMAREIRVVEEASGAEIPCQVYAEEEERPEKHSEKHCTVVFLATAAARERKVYLVLYGNSSPACWQPFYSTDLVTRGEGWALEIENSVYRARLSRVMGQLRTLQFKLWGETSLPTSGWADPSPINVVDAQNDPERDLDIAWHGEDYCIHWNPDFSEQLRFRITNWPEPPNYEVVRGPLCTIVKRWGYPVSPLYPALPQTAVTIAVTYTFYQGLPYLTMESRLDVEEEVDIGWVRNDEWLFGSAFTHCLSMVEGGEVEVYDERRAFEENPAFVGLVNEKTQDAFASLRLSYDSRGFPRAYDPKQNNVGTTTGGNGIWARGPFYVKDKEGSMAIQPGATIGEYNAYLAYNVGEEGGHGQAADWYARLRHPLRVTGAD